MMKTEFEKMRTGDLYDFSDPEIASSLVHGKEACLRLNRLTITSEGYREALRELIPGIPDSTKVCPPFFCDHGSGIRMGEDVFINYNCTVLDGAYVTFGDHVKVGPNCQFYTPDHPHDYMARRGTRETAHPIVIGRDTWLGGGCIVLPGVSIGARCIVGAGSVVTRDVPDDCVVAGNPARVLRKMDGEKK